MTSMITATAWVPRGHAAAFPTKYNMDDEEYARIAKLAKLELDDAKEDLEKARDALNKVSMGDTEDAENGAEKESESEESGDEDNDIAKDDDLAEYDMDHYDDEPDVPAEDDDEPTGGIFSNIKSLAYHADNSEDPYLTLPEGEVSDDEEREELQILPTDNVVLAARIEDEVAHLEVYVYEDEADNLYVHHDVMLPAVPLCVEWVGTRVGQADAAEGGNFAAVGTMDPEIELWDLDIVDCMYPNAVLGQNSQPQAPEPITTKKKKKSKKANDAYHVDSVLSLAANRQHRNLLASASADKTVKLWDLNTCTAAHSYAHHTDKVCALAWHPSQTSVLLSGSYDRTIVAADMRAPDTNVPRWGVESDVEQLRWDPHNDNHFYVSTESGVLHCFDARQLPSTPEKSKAVWRLQAHEKELSSFSINPAVPGFIATASTDRTVKLWNVTEKGPSMVVSRDLEVGKVFSANFAPDNEIAFRLAVAGSKGAVQVWDTSTNKAVREAFAGRVKMPEGDVKERLVGIEQDDEVEEEEAEAEENGGEGGWESMDED
ncbi:putative WD repeat-containing protein C17D11.16 [Pseudocercospora fuligena]|uniref:Putative WD repeat-containing protein C17D11.16 n=1 Tax=Pseudocercospora fuligena TaxID=685502 RepID=A0A8H6VFB4_9PEZI|nr:putative WD repeat-containing protein C17D11.16 [Pseudocercospora fuligena]